MMLLIKLDIWNIYGFIAQYIPIMFVSSTLGISMASFGQITKHYCKEGLDRIRFRWTVYYRIRGALDRICRAVKWLRFGPVRLQSKRAKDLYAARIWRDAAQTRMIWS